jgi:nitroimidazol reductase NimA-like FMN-containing flavoprotein (pyridoxamine 5'-phosphate oxidase superfamily)
LSERGGEGASTGWRIAAGFDLDAFLAEPHVARIATVGPRVHPVWFLWEQSAFWWLTGGWSRMPRTLAEDPSVAIVIDTCDLATGTVLQVNARGRAEILAFDPERARRWGVRYLGPDERHWGRFADGVFRDETTRFVRLAPLALSAKDLSWAPGDR